MLRGSLITGDAQNQETLTDSNGSMTAW